MELEIIDSLPLVLETSEVLDYTPILENLLKQLEITNSLLYTLGYILIFSLVFSLIHYVLNKFF